MGDARIRFSPVWVVGVVHGFPVVDWGYHSLNVMFFRCIIPFLIYWPCLGSRVQASHPRLHCWSQKRRIIRRPVWLSYVNFIIHMCFIWVLELYPCSAQWRCFEGPWFLFVSLTGQSLVWLSPRLPSALNAPTHAPHSGGTYSQWRRATNCISHWFLLNINLN